MERVSDFHCKTMENVSVETVSDFIFLGTPKLLQMVTAAIKLKDTPSKESYDQPR